MSEISADANATKAALARRQKAVRSQIVSGFVLAAILLWIVVSAGIEANYILNNGVAVSAEINTTVTSKSETTEIISYKSGGTQIDIPRGAYQNIAWPGQVGASVPLKVDPHVPVYFMPVGSVSAGTWAKYLVMLAIAGAFIFSGVTGLKAIRASKTMPDDEALEYFRAKYPDNRSWSKRYLPLTSSINPRKWADD